MDEIRRGKVVVISGPSGVGKSTICKAIVKQLKNVYHSVSVTTRPQAQGEVDGKDYWFLSQQEFERRKKDGMLLEYAEVFGNWYGTPKDKADEALRQGKTVILEIDVQGGQNVKKIYTDAVMIFILPPNKDALNQRITGRGRDDSKTSAGRLKMAEHEMDVARQHYEYMVVNDDLEQAINKVITIIRKAIGEKNDRRP